MREQSHAVDDLWVSDARDESWCTVAMCHSQTQEARQWHKMLQLQFGVSGAGNKTVSQSHFGGLKSRKWCLEMTNCHSQRCSL